jgi:isopenicillin N synthase-like dioxygenase
MTAQIPLQIPVIDVSALAGPPSAARDGVDAAILAAAREVGFFTIIGLPAAVPLGGPARARLLGIFAAGAEVQRPLWRAKFQAGNKNVYRGWFPRQVGQLTCKEGMDIGGDVVHGARLVCAGDPLREATPLPREADLPGWRAAIAQYYASMERVAAALLRAIARALALPADTFDAAFHEGLSTLRLLRYPIRDAADLARCPDPGLLVDDGGERRYVMGAAHTDSGFLTLLAQDGVAGLQARARDGAWLSVPPRDDALVVNFGQMLEHWSGARIRATEHRVLGAGEERHAIAFFYEARADAEIRPTPLDPPDAFAPFYFGDYLWARITQFVEFRGMEGERPATRPTAVRGRG